MVIAAAHFNWNNVCVLSFPASQLPRQFLKYYHLSNPLFHSQLKTYIFHGHKSFRVPKNYVPLRDYSLLYNMSQSRFITNISIVYIVRRVCGCWQPIGKGGIVYNNSPWHRDCFCCSHCQHVLGRERFTSVEDRPYCVNCYGQLFAKKCSTCTKPITGTCQSQPIRAARNCANW